MAQANPSPLRLDPEDVTVDVWSSRGPQASVHRSGIRGFGSWWRWVAGRGRSARSADGSAAPDGSDRARISQNRQLFSAELVSKDGKEKVAVESASRMAVLTVLRLAASSAVIESSPLHSPMQTLGTPSRSSSAARMSTSQVNSPLRRRCEGLMNYPMEVALIEVLESVLVMWFEWDAMLVSLGPRVVRTHRPILLRASHAAHVGSGTWPVALVVTSDVRAGQMTPLVSPDVFNRPIASWRGTGPLVPIDFTVKSEAP